MSNWQEQQKQVATGVTDGSRKTPQTEALKLALKALKNGIAKPEEYSKAITAVKEALAQPEHDWIERERAVGYREGHQNALKQMAQQAAE